MKKNLRNLLCAMHMQEKIRLLAAVVLLVSGSMNALAGIDITAIPGTYSVVNGAYIITQDGEYTFTGDGNEIGSKRIVVSPNLSVNITIKNVYIKSTDSAAFSIGDATTVFLTLEGENKLYGGDKFAGLRVAMPSSLQIKGGDNDTLIAVGGKGGAGIGGNENEASGVIQIVGGYIKATGGDDGAGIGGGSGGFGVVSISGGIVEATGKKGGAGVGGGHNGQGTMILINGGKLVATGGDGGGAGIGGGSNCNGKVSIEGGVVSNATGGSGGAGIGGGSNGGNGNVTITDGIVEATGNGAGAGVGGGGNGEGTVTISGGKLVATSTVMGAGIGGGNTGKGTVVIDGGEVRGIGSVYGAGIGGGNGRGGDVTIKGGKVEAEAVDGAGIGGGNNNSNSSKVTISGGTVFAESATGKDIGGGAGSTFPDTVFIDGGSVKVNTPSNIHPINSVGDTVYLTELTLRRGSSVVDTVKAGSIDGYSCEEVANAPDSIYGINDVWTDDAGKLYFWLRKTNSSEAIAVTTTTGVTYDNRFIRNGNNSSNKDTLYKSPATVISVTPSSPPRPDEVYVDTSGDVKITFSRPMRAGIYPEDTVVLLCSDCREKEVLLPQRQGDRAWENSAYPCVLSIPFSGLEYSSEYRVLVKGFRDTVPNPVVENSEYFFYTTMMQMIEPASYIEKAHYYVGDSIVAEKGAYTPNEGGEEGNHHYQWYRADSDDPDDVGTPIVNATDSVYVPVDDDFGKYVYVVTSPVGSEGHQSKPAESEKLRVGVKVTVEVAGGHEGTVCLTDGVTDECRCDTVVYDTRTPIPLLVTKNFSDDVFLGWRDSIEGNDAGGKFSPGSSFPESAYTVPAAPAGNITLTAVLKKGAPALSLPTPGTPSGMPPGSNITYGDTLRKLPLEGGNVPTVGTFTWKDIDTVLTAGSHDVIVSFTPTDDYDYSDHPGWNSNTGTVDTCCVQVVVDKKTITIVGGSVEQKTYDGSDVAEVKDIEFSGLVGDDKLILDEDYSVKGDAKFDSPEAGTDKEVAVTIELKNTDVTSNYTLEDDSYTLEGQAIDKIPLTKDDLLLTPDLDPDSDPDKGVVYDGGEHGGAVTVKPDFCPACADLDNDKMEITYKDDKGNPVELPVDAGEYTVIVKLEDDPNYQDITIEVGIFVIEKAPLTEDNLLFEPDEVIYDGQPHGDDVKVSLNPDFCPACAALDNDNIEVTYKDEEGNPVESPVDAGEYTVTIEIKDAPNYRDTTIEIGTPFVIKKAPLTEDDLRFDPPKIPYDGQPHGDDVEVSLNKPDFCPACADLDNDKMEITYKDDKGNPVESPVDAGEYTVIVKLEDDPSYQDITVEVGIFVIEKASLTEDALSFITPDRVVYDGQPHGDDVKVLLNPDFCPACAARDNDNINDNIEITYKDEEGNPVESPVDAGEYTVTVEIKDAPNYRDTTIEIGPFVIEKATIKKDDLQFEGFDGVQYDGQEHGVEVLPSPSFPCQGPSCADIDDIVKITYDRKDGEGSPVTSVVDAGEYTVTVTVDNPNYKYDEFTDEFTLDEDFVVKKAPLTEKDLLYGPKKVTCGGPDRGVVVTPIPGISGVGEIDISYIDADGRVVKEAVEEGTYIVRVVMVGEGTNFAKDDAKIELEGTFQVVPATHLYDTICQGEAYAKNGFPLPAQSASDTHTITYKVDYDSIVWLHLTVNEQIRLGSVSRLVTSCDDNPAVEYELESGHPTHYSIAFSGAAQRFFANVDGEPLPAAAIPIRIPSDARHDDYEATVMLSDNACRSEEQPFTLTLRYPTEAVMSQKWDDVIALYKNNRWGYEFTAYQWLKGEEDIPGAALPYLYVSPTFDFSAIYSVRLTRSDDGVEQLTCPFRPRRQDVESSVTTYPTIVASGGSITVTAAQHGEAVIRNIQGAVAGRQKFAAGASSIAAPREKGVYLVELRAADGKMKMVKIVVK